MRTGRLLLAVALLGLTIGCGSDGVATLGAAPSPAASTAAAKQAPTVRMIGCFKALSARPTRVMVACGDGSAYMTGLSWSRWTSTEATAQGTWHQNDCVPYCAAGHFHRYPVTLRMDEPVTVHGLLVFGHVVATFPANVPGPPAYRDHRETLYNHARPCAGCPVWRPLS